MAIPKVNLIPAAYYLRKKVKAATAIAVFLLLAEAVALMAYAFYQKGVVERLTNEQTVAQNAVDNINNIKMINHYQMMIPPYTNPKMKL